MRPCSVPGCPTPARSLGLCPRHYQAKRRNGDPTTRKRTANGEPYRFFEEALLLETDDCILWPYGTGSHGYGQMTAPGEGVQTTVHVRACERLHGPRPTGHEVLHGPCNNSRCFNPRHLSWGTRKQNSIDKLRDGSQKLGEESPLAILTEQAVLDIRKSYADGVSRRELANEYGVSWACINAVIHRVTWKHI